MTLSLMEAAAPNALKKELRATGLMEKPLNMNGVMAALNPAVRMNLRLFIFRR
jgi:hypothetical protein